MKLLLLEMGSALVVSVAVASRLAAPAAAQLECPPIVLLYDDNEKLRERQTDTNGDCRPDQWVYYEQGVPQRAEQDMDYDGTKDAWVRYGPDRLPAYQEIDTTGDGKVDQWIDLEAGQPVRRRDDRNADGVPDATTIFQGGVPTRQEEDTNFDSQIDRWTEYQDGAPALVAQDRNRDGRIDLRAEFNPDGSLRVEHIDGNEDGALNLHVFYAGGQRVRVEEDTVADGKIDLVTHFAGELIVRREADTTGDGRFDTIANFESGFERNRTRDEDGDGHPEIVAQMDARGRLLREQIDSPDVGRIGHFDLQQGPGFRIQRGFPELVRVHFAQPLVALQAEALFALLQDRIQQVGGAVNGDVAVFAHQNCCVGVNLSDVLRDL